MGKIASLSRGIRALHAKMHIIREESLQQAENASSVEASLAAQYESIGTDLKSLVQEWEEGKSCMTPPPPPPSWDKHSTGNHSSHSSTTLKSPPLSPAFSLGGRTAVDNDDVLTSLNGENKPSSKFVDDEEIFEADARPRHRKRASLTRDERIARVREERARKTATRDRIDTNTNMLKELEMVIKQRPRAQTLSARVSSL